MAKKDNGIDIREKGTMVRESATETATATATVTITVTVTTKSTIKDSDKKKDYDKDIGKDHCPFSMWNRALSKSAFAMYSCFLDLRIRVRGRVSI